MKNLNWNVKYKRSVPCLSMLPKYWTMKILALASPRNVCGISPVSKSLQSGGESDFVCE